MQIINFAFRFLLQFLFSKLRGDGMGLRYGAGKAAFLACLLAMPPMAMANGTFSPQGQPSAAALDIRVMIPAILRILEDSHPHSLIRENEKSTSVSALQRLVLVSTLGKGFCMDLQLSQRQLTDWRLRVSGSPGTWVEPSGAGYRLCAGRSGRYDIALQHDFNVKRSPTEPVADAIGWPVSTNLSAP